MSGVTQSTQAQRTGGVIVAAGAGTRFGDAEHPKQREDLRGLPVYLHSVLTFSKSARIEKIALVVREEDLAAIEAEVAEQHFDKPIEIISGGSSRQRSVGKGLLALERAGMNYALVHDAVRPLMRQGLLERMIDGFRKHEALLAAIPVVDSLKEVGDKTVLRTISRENLWQAQTPQGARLDVLLEAIRAAEQAGFQGTDESELLERFGLSVHIIQGDPENFKITYPKDLERASAVLASRVAIA